MIVMTEGEYMDLLLASGDPEFTKVYAEVQAESDKNFSDYDTVVDWDNLTDEQDATITDRSISHKERMAKLTAIRDRTAKAKTFSKRLTRAGRIHAQALGIKLRAYQMRASALQADGLSSYVTQGCGRASHLS
jgi:hypothetical protein